MNFYTISALINFITSSILGVFVISKSRNNKNIGFFIFCFSVAVWSFFYFFWQLSNNGTDALFFIKALMGGAIFIPVAYLHFVYALLETLKTKFKFLIFSYFLFFLFFLINFSSYFIKNVEPLLNFKFWPIAGPAFNLFLVVWFFYVIYSTYILFEKYKSSTGIIRLQIKYVILGMIIGFTGGSTNYFLWYKIPIPPILNILVSVYVGTVAYSIIKYRLMDIQIVARKIFIYFGLASFVYIFFYSVIWFYNLFFGSVFAMPAYLAGIIFAPIFTAAFYGIDKGLRIFANKYLFASLYNYQKTINKLADDLNNYIDLEKINNLIIKTIKDTMKLDNAEVFLDNYKNKKLLNKNNFLYEYILKIEKPVVRDEFLIIANETKTKEEKERLEKIYNYLKSIDAAICLPLVTNKKLIGVINLGSKISGDAYTREDLELLNTLSKQAAIAIDNARLYKQVQDFNSTLQKKVEEQTKEIKEAYELEKEAHKELERLDTAKTQFMIATQHHLRTPLTAIRGYVELLLDGSFGKIPTKIKEPIQKIQISGNRLIRVVNEFLDVSQFQMGREVISVKNGVDIEPIMSEIIEELKFEADNKKIYLKLEKEKNLPKIIADPEKLKIALFNFVDNGIKYTTTGGLTVKLLKSDTNLEITITDTGIGISKEDLKTLFSRVFERGKGAKEVNGTGRGIGLYIASHIIYDHKGKVWAESEGRGKGSVFHIELPIDKGAVSQKIAKKATDAALAA